MAGTYLNLYNLIKQAKLVKKIMKSGINNELSVSCFVLHDRTFS